MKNLQEAVDHNVSAGKIALSVAAVATGILAAAETIGETCLRIIPTTAAFVATPFLSNENSFKQTFSFSNLIGKVKQIFQLIIGVLLTILSPINGCSYNVNFQLPQKTTPDAKSPSPTETGDIKSSPAISAANAISTPPAPSSKPTPPPADRAAPTLCFRGSALMSKKVEELLESLNELPPMDKTAMSCTRDRNNSAPYRVRMQKFMKDNFGKQSLDKRYFVPGVPAFELTRAIASHKDEEVIAFEDDSGKYVMTVKEIKEWQQSYRVFYPESSSFSKKEICQWLQGQSKEGEEAAAMKFVLRIAKTPILRDFDGKIISRSHDEATGEIYLVSACGVDFAARKHDSEDIKRYIVNWKDVVETAPSGEIVYPNSRDMALKPVVPQLNEALLLEDLKKMARLRFRAQDQMGVEVAVESGLGLGIFAGDRLGIDLADRVRTLSAQAVKEVLEEEKFTHIKLVCFALPIFRKKDNYEYFAAGFKGYEGQTPVLILDQDMHKIADTAAVSKNSDGKRVNRFVTSELNPADSHGVFGEYWEGKGPGTEEKLAFTTAGLLTQHHACNPCVLEEENYQGIKID